jgi:shikimate dehydrogenase
MTTKVGVMGWPVEHSKSPRLHGYWLKQYGIDGSYVHLPVSPEGLATALADLSQQGFAGVNLTVPHKEAALGLVHEVSDVAARIGAINTIFVENGRLKGTNTDAYGFITALGAGAPRYEPTTAPAVVIGAGGAARAVCFALQDAGCPEIRVVNRTAARAQNLVGDFGDPLVAVAWEDRAHSLKNVGLLVNTTTMGMRGHPVLDLDLSALPVAAVVNDIVYTPLETPLLAAARGRSYTVVDGLGMLLYQAQAGFEGWFGVKPAVTAALRAHVLNTNALAVP